MIDPHLLHCGIEFFPALIQAIDSAVQDIYLETYIFFDDETGDAVAAALIRAARRGVSVHLLIDGFGSKEYPQSKRDALKSGGVQLRIYRPGFMNFRFLRTGLRRLHRKLVVIDERIAFVGGINVLHDFDPGVTAPRYDFAVMSHGPLVADVSRTVRQLWSMVGRSQLLNPAPRATPFSKTAEQSPVRLLLRDNFRNRRTIKTAYLEGFRQARHRILIANAYFLPGRKLLKSITDAASRGVQVDILLQGRVEYFLQHYASQYLYRRLIKAGVRIHLYQASLLHAKVAVIDDNWATVGSSNMDPFSLQLAREANVLVRDSRFVEVLSADLTDAMRNQAIQIDQREWAATPWHQKLLMRTCYGLLRLSQQFLTRGE